MNIKDLDELEALTALIAGEAAGETMAGKMAVACVVRNRREDKRWPNNWKEVIFQRYQFSCMNNIPSDGEIPQDLWTKCFIVRPADIWWRECKLSSFGSLYDWYGDITDGANHYYAHTLMGEPSWAKDRKSQLTIGGHKFYRL